jgi:hypothetical protein
MSVLNFGRFKNTDLREVPLPYLQAVAPILMTQARLLQDELDRRIADRALAIEDRPAQVAAVAV